MLNQLTKPTQSYITLAEALNERRLSTDDLAKKAADLPPLTLDLLNDLSECATAESLQSPRLGWAIMTVTDAAAQHQDDDLLSALAAWHLGRLANEYGRPKRTRDPLDRAERLFRDLNKPNWLAAVTWQRHALPWASANLSLAVNELESAVAGLENSSPPLKVYTPHCRLTLAYAKLLKGGSEDLSDLLEGCLNHFTAAGDRLNQARTLFVHSGYLRRNAPFQEAKAASFEGFELAQSINAAADIGRFYCQIGYNHWLCDGNYEAAAESFQTAIDLFQGLDIPGWLAQCQDGLAQIYIMTGRLSEAGQLLQSSLSIFKEEEAPGQLPPTQLTAGWLEMLRGNYQSSLDYLKQSEDGYRKSGKQAMIPVVQMHQGETNLLLGRFQQSLQNLEQAYTILETLDSQSRLAECSLRFAQLWTTLDNPQNAQQALAKLKEHAQEADHASALLAYYFISADLFNHQRKSNEAIESLNEALQLAQKQKNPSMLALCRRQLARAYTQQEKLELAIEQLTLAETSIREMGLRHEQAACLLIWGDIYRQQSRRQSAMEAWNEAEELSRDILPDLNWQAAAALAELATEKNKNQEALAHYRQMVKSLRLLRQGFWQPELAGGYLIRPSAPLNQAILLTARIGRHQDSLTFIEESKAQTTARRIQAQALFQEFELIPAKVQEMTAEIRWLQKDLRTSDAGLFTPSRSAEYENKYLQLQEKIDAYSEQLNRLQREQIDDAHVPINDSFNIEQFRLLADKHLGTDWLALNYYQAGGQLICFLLSPNTATAYYIQVPDALELAFEKLQHPQGINEKLLHRILKGAGETLIPSAVQKYLKENTVLIISPHGDLHQLPWTALHINGPTYCPLVDVVTPVIVPSFQTLTLLWQRETNGPVKANGILLAVSDFQGRHPTLPAVRQEAQRLIPFLGENGRILLDQDATASALLSTMRNKSNNQQYEFWHIASHAFYDEHSGRLSGLALYDQDFLIDELWLLAPLPGLVTFSACGSSKSHLFEGDEHVSLTTTCLTAGANHVVGSIWDVQDTRMPSIMADFYSRLLHPQEGTAVPVSQALAQAQRLAWKSGESWQQWAGFRCTGRP